MQMFRRAGVTGLLLIGVCLGQPQVRGHFGVAPEKFRDYQVILEPDQDAPEWWAGAPSVVRDPSGVFWMACRMRTADSPLGLRGYEIRILRSEDGIRFRKVHSLLREKVPIPGFEPASARPVIQPRPKSGPREVTPDGYKDPFIVHAEGAYHCFVIGVLRTERVFHFRSADGETWAQATCSSTKARTRNGMTRSTTSPPGWPSPSTSSTSST